MASTAAITQRKKPAERPNLKTARNWVRGLGKIFQRVALFQIDGTHARVVAVKGIPSRPVGESISLLDPTPLRWAVEAASPIVGAGRSPGAIIIPAALGMPTPRAFAIMPLVIQRRLVALAYADNGPKPLPVSNVGELFDYCAQVLEGKQTTAKPLPRIGLQSSARRDSPGRYRSPGFQQQRRAPGETEPERLELLRIDSPGVDDDTGKASRETINAALQAALNQLADDPRTGLGRGGSVLEAVAAPMPPRSLSASPPSASPAVPVTAANDAVPLAPREGQTPCAARADDDEAGLLSVSAIEALAFGIAMEGETEEATLAVETAEPTAAMPLVPGADHYRPEVPAPALIVPAPNGARTPARESASGRGVEVEREVLPAADAERSVPALTDDGREALAEVEREALAEVEREDVVAGETVRAGERETARAGETETVRAGERETARAGETETVRAGERETARAGETEAVRGGERETARAGETEAVRTGETEAVRTGETEAESRVEPRRAQPPPIPAEAMRFDNGRDEPASAAVAAGAPMVPDFEADPRVVYEQILSGKLVVTPTGILPANAVQRERRPVNWRRVGAIAGSGLAMLLVWALVSLSPPGEIEGNRLVEILPNSRLSEISIQLTEEGVVRSPKAFALLARFSGVDRELRAGTYNLPTGVWAWTVLAELHAGQVQTRQVTIPEGTTLREVATLLERAGLASSARLIKEARDPELLTKYGITAPSVEGFLFPETYTLAEGLSERQVLEAMLDQFFAKLETIPRAGELSRGALFDRVILASIVERETQDPQERRRVAGVFENRIERNMKLESCATVQYILNSPKAHLRHADLRIESPYNTYRNEGLPPGPIANPGLGALTAALQPEEHDFLFFVAREDGTKKHIFTKSYAAHEAVLKKVRGRR